METPEFEQDRFHGNILRLKHDPQVWLSRNPSLASRVDTLILELADDVEKLSDSFGDMFNIRDLEIKRGKTLKYLPHSLTTLPLLKGLIVQNCPVLEELPSSLGQLSSLESLIVENCPVMKELPSSLGQLSSLEWLSLTGCGIKCLPDNLHNLHNWVSLELVNCPNLEKLPCNMAHIDCIRLVNCPIESLPVGFSVGTLQLEGCCVKCFSSKPRNLKTFTLSKCLCVRDILANSKVFNNLQSLHIDGYEMESLPDAITELCNLENLEFSDCMNLEKLPEKVGWLVNLNSLGLVCCGIKYIPLGLCNLTSLLIDTCPIDFQVCKEFLSGLTKLKILVISECETLQELSTNLKTLVSLRELHIRRCSNFKFLPSFGALLQLGCLYLDGCLCLSELPGDFDELTNLSDLNLEDTNIQSLPSTITKLPKLKFLTLPACFKLETLPNDLNLDLITVYIPQHYRLDTLPTKFSLSTYGCKYRLHLKVTICDEANSEPDPEELREGIISEQTIVKTPANLTDLLLGDGLDVTGETAIYHTLLTPRDGTSEHQNRRHRSLELTKGADSGANDLGIENNEAILLDAYDQDDEVMSEATNQQTSGFEGGETSESEGEEYQPLGLTEESNSSANDVTSEPMNKKDQHGKRRKINNEEVLRLRGSGITRREAAFQLKIPVGTFNHHLRFEKIKWPYNRAKKQPRTAKRSSSISCIKAEYAGDIVKVESSSTTSIDELRDRVRKKLNLEGRRFKLKYLDETNEKITMVDNSDVVDAFKASSVRNEVFVRIWVMDV